MRWTAVLVGAGLWFLTFHSVMRTLVVPRGTSGIVTWKNRALLGVFRGWGRRRSTYAGRDNVLSWVAPLSIVTSLVMWLLLFFASYALLMYGTTDLPLRTQIREAGSSLFTLGFASTDRNALTALDFAAAATGPIVIGLLIGYLPTIYSAYQSRENEVTLLLGRAGEPNWGPELLARHAVVGNTEKLVDLWPAWEQWAAQVAESHTNFPILIQMRSSRPHRNWLVALLSVMDAAAMHMSLNPDLPQGDMRLLLRQGIVCLRELATVQRIPFDDDPLPDRPTDISEAEFLQVCEAMGRARYAWQVEPAAAYPHFRGWRANYEDVAYELAAQIDAVPAPWSGPRRPPLEVIPPHRPPNRSPEHPIDPTLPEDGPESLPQP